MKKIYLLLIISTFSASIFSQEKQILKDGNYYLDFAIDLNKLQTSDKSSEDFFKNSDYFKGSNYTLSVKSIIDNQVNFKFFHFNNPKLNIVINGDADKDVTVYSLPLEDFKNIVSPLYNRVDWRVGIYTVPFKLRFGDFDFDSNVNLGTNIGCKIRIYRKIENGFSIEPIIGIGLASIKMDNGNSKIESPTNVGAFTVNTGVLFHMNSSINVGFTYGFDNLSNNDQKTYDWKYDGNGWLGIGINVAFSKDAKNTGSDSKNNP